MEKIVFFFALIVVFVIPIEGYAIVDGLSYNGIFYPVMMAFALLSPRTLIPPDKKYIILAIIFVMYCYASTLWSGFPDETLYRSFVMTQHLVFIIILERIITDNNRFKNILIAYIIGAVICAGGMIFEVMTFGVQNENESAGVFRSRMFGNSNENAFLIAYAIIFIFILISKYNPKPVFRTTLWVIILFLVLSVFISGSRNGFIITLLTVSFIGLYYFKGFYISGIFTFFILFVVFVYVVLPYIPQEYIERIMNIEFALENKQLSNREIIWDNASKMMNRPDFSMLIGEGWGTFLDNYRNYTGVEYGAHNFYINTLFTLGVLGVIMIVVYLYNLYSKIIIFRKQGWIYLLLLFVPMISMMTTNWDTRKWWFFMGVIIYKFCQYFGDDDRPALKVY